MTPQSLGEWGNVMEAYCGALAAALPPVWEDNEPHLFSGDFFEALCRRIESGGEGDS